MKEITKRKILFISHSSSLGGAPKVLIDVINTLLLENSNYLCYVICPRSRQKSFELYYQNNDKVIVKELMYRSGSANVIKSLLVLFYNIPSIFYLLWFSKKSKIDTIYINSSTCFIGVLLSLLTKIKTIFHIHEHNNAYVKVIPNYLYPIYLKLFNSNNLSCVVFPSELTASSWELEFNMRFEGKLILYATVQNLNLQKINLIEKKFVIGYVGGLFIEKNIMTLLIVFKEFIKNNSTSDIQLLLFGNGPFEKSIISFANKNNLASFIKIEKELTQPIDIYKNISVLVQPSYMESWSLVAAEALSLRVPLIISKNSGIVEILENKNSALIFNPLDPKELLECLNLVYNDSKFCDVITSNGFSLLNELNINNRFKSKIEQLFCEA